MYKIETRCKDCKYWFKHLRPVHFIRTESYDCCSIAAFRVWQLANGRQEKNDKEEIDSLTDFIGRENLEALLLLASVPDEINN